MGVQNDLIVKYFYTVIAIIFIIITIDCCHFPGEKNIPTSLKKVKNQI